MTISTSATNTFLAILAIVGLHYSSVILPIALAYPHIALEISSCGLLKIPPLSDWGSVVILACIAVNLFSLIIVALLLTNTQYRQRWFYRRTLGTLITMVFAIVLADALWNIPIIIAVWLSFRRRRTEFFPDRLPDHFPT